VTHSLTPISQRENVLMPKDSHAGVTDAPSNELRRQPHFRGQPCCARREEENVSMQFLLAIAFFCWDLAGLAGSRATDWLSFLLRSFERNVLRGRTTLMLRASFPFCCVVLAVVCSDSIQPYTTVPLPLLCPGVHWPKPAIPSPCRCGAVIKTVDAWPDIVLSSVLMRCAHVHAK
jgi:hypothetical protein